MKKIIVFVMLLIISATSFSQQTKPSPTLNKQHYLQKSKKQLIAACIFFGSGTFAIYMNSRHKSFSESGGPVLIGGIIANLTGNILFVASYNSKRKAMRLSFKNETVPQLQNGSFINRTVPSLALKISL